MENEIEDIDSTNDGGEQDTEQPDNVETPTLEDYNALKEKNKELFARAKKAEEEAKKIKAKPQETETKKTNETVGLTRDEAILIAKGVDDRVIDEAKLIAEAKGIPLREALDYPTIKSFQRDLEQEAKKEKAQLGASRGGSYADDDLTQKVGMSREEHKKAIGM